MKIKVDYREKSSGLIDLLEKEDVIIEVKTIIFATRASKCGSDAIKKIDATFQVCLRSDDCIY